MRRNLAANSITCIIAVFIISTMLLGCGVKVARDESGNTPPVVDDVIVPAYVIVELTVEGHDVDGDKLNYVWEVEKGELDSNTKRTVKWRLPSDVKSATVKVNANDGVHNSNSVSRKITVNLRNVAPVIKRIVVPESVIAGERIQLEAETYDPDGDSLAFNWSTEVGVLSSTTSKTPTWIAPVEGVLAPVELRVNDGINEPTVKSATIKVVGHPLIVAGEQAAGIRLGDPFNKVKALYGEPDRPPDSSGYFAYRAMRISGFVDGINLVESLYIRKPNESKTSGGVGIGSDRRRVEEEFGPAERIRETEYGKRYKYPKKGISFRYDEDSRVTDISVSKPRR